MLARTGASGRYMERLRREYSFMKSVKKVRTGRPSVTPPRVKRQIGRPDSNAEVVGPEALIEKTCELLAKLPPAKVTRAEVARYAGVDPALIRYYFQNRTSLLVASAEKLMTGFEATFEHGLQRESSSTSGKLKARMGALLELIVSHPFYHRLLTEELFTSESPAAAELLKKMAEKGVGAYESLVTAGVDDGSFRDVSGAFLFIAVVGMCDAFVSLAPILDISLGKTAAPQMRRREYEEFVSNLLLHGVMKVPPK